MLLLQEYWVYWTILDDKAVIAQVARVAAVAGLRVIDQRLHIVLAIAIEDMGADEAALAQH